MLDIEQLYEERFNDLKKVVKRYIKDDEDANDITQDTFIRAWSSLDSFRGDSEPFTWLTRIAYNIAYDHKYGKKLSTTPLLVMDGEEVLPTTYKDIGSPESILLAEEKELDMMEKLKGLDNKYKQPFILCDYHGNSYQEIADELGIPVNTVRSRIYRARKQIHQAD